jgi:hypothetical protein
VRRELNPYLLQAGVGARRCFEQRGFTTGPVAELEWRRASSRGKATAEGFHVRKVEGGADPEQAAAQACLDQAFADLDSARA